MISFEAYKPAPTDALASTDELLLSFIIASAVFCLGGSYFGPLLVEVEGACSIPIIAANNSLIYSSSLYAAGACAQFGALAIILHPKPNDSSSAPKHSASSSSNSSRRSSWPSYAAQANKSALSSRSDICSAKSS